MLRSTCTRFDMTDDGFYRRQSIMKLRFVCGSRIRNG
jgi:hypothetical protein